MRKIPYQTRTYSCRVCSVAFEGYFVGRHWYCDNCRLEHYAAQRTANSWIQRAIRAGVLMPAWMLRCIDCGEWAHGWEHRDYSKPLEVDPTCSGCNFKRGPALFSRPLEAKVLNSPRGQSMRDALFPKRGLAPS